MRDLDAASGEIARLGNLIVERLSALKWVGRHIVAGLSNSPPHE
jgi:hypothetical protein